MDTLTLDELKNHPEPVIRELTAKIDQLQSAVVAGDISEGEYRELCEDLLDASKVLQNNNNITNRLRVERGLELLFRLSRGVVKLNT